jgi:alpha-mannosidase
LKDFEFQYSLCPHLGDWKNGKSYQKGYEFNYSPIAYQLPENKKYRAKRSFLKIDPQNVVLTAVKKPEDGEKKEIIIRFYEAEGKKTKTILTFFRKPKKVETVNLIEENETVKKKKIKIRDNKIKLQINPFEIVTLKVKF